MNTQITLRPYRDEDFAAATALWHDSKRDAFPYVATIQAHTLEGDRAYFRANYPGRADIIFAELGGETAGIMVLSDDLIEQLFVATWAHHQGIGTALVLHAKRASPKGVRLFTFRRNEPARRLYERQGFIATGFGISPEPESEPDVEYLWQPAAVAEPASARPGEDQQPGCPRNEGRALDGAVST